MEALMVRGEISVSRASCIYAGDERTGKSKFSGMVVEIFNSKGSYEFGACRDQ